MSRIARLPGSIACVVLAGAICSACGSGSHPAPSLAASSGSNPGQTAAARDGLSFSRCMRSHGVPNFPDPTANGGGFNISNSGGMNPSSPAFVAAQTACEHLLPVKHPPSGPPSARAFTRLVHWAECMRAHGLSGLPDPRPDPPPSPGSPAAARYGTLMGDGGYWVGIPISVNAHSAAFIHLSTVCGESPTGPHG